MLLVLKRTVSFEHPKYMLNIMGKKIFTIMRFDYAIMQIKAIRVYSRRWQSRDRGLQVLKGAFKVFF